MTFKILVAALLSAFLLVSVPAQARQREADPRPAPDANVFFIRVHAVPFLYGATVNVDGADIANLRERNYTAVHLAPGTHALELRWSWMAAQAPDRFDLRIEDGQVYYFEVGTSGPPVRYTYAGRGIVLTDDRRVSAMSEIGEQEGRQLAASCCEFKRSRVEGIIPAPPPRPPKGQGATDATPPPS